MRHLTWTSIVLCGEAAALALGIAAAPAFKAMTPDEGPSIAPFSSALHRDQAAFARDLHHLRRDLRRRADTAIVTIDRRAAQADWMSIVTDRRPGAPADTWQTEVARRRSGIRARRS